MNDARPLRKRFGQHFLADTYAIDRIIGLVAPQVAEHILEIGPGGGVLTAPLVATGAQVTAIEIDRDLAAALTARFIDAENFTLINADVLKTDFATITRASSNWKVVGNLPYNISTPLIMRLLERASSWTVMTIMVQREVAERLTAPVDSSAYGRLSVMAQRRADIALCLDVPPTAFVPPPKVESAVVQLTPRPETLSGAALARLDDIVRSAFSQRRKMLARSLRPLFTAAELEAQSVNPGARPETLAAADFERLAQALAAREAGA